MVKKDVNSDTMFDGLLQATGRQVSRLAYHRGTVRDCSWHPTEPMLVSSSWDGNLAKWEHLHGDKPLARNQRCFQMPQSNFHDFFPDDDWKLVVVVFRGVSTDFSDIHCEAMMGQATYKKSNLMPLETQNSCPEFRWAVVIFICRNVLLVVFY